MKITKKQEAAAAAHIRKRMEEKTDIRDDNFLNTVARESKKVPKLPPKKKG